MHTIQDLSERTRSHLAGHNVIVFDGDCVLCSRFMQFVLRFDREKRFQFVVAQSDLGTRLYQELGLPDRAYETNLVIVCGQIFTKLDAFCAVMRRLGGVWSGLSVLAWLPRWLKDPAYHAIARNRYALFGRRDTCLMPSADLKARFLDFEPGQAGT